MCIFNVCAIIYSALFLGIVIYFSPYSSPWGFILTILRAHGGPLTLNWITHPPSNASFTLASSNNFFPTPFLFLLDHSGYLTPCNYLWHPVISTTS